MGKARRTNFMEFFSLAVVDNVKPNYLAVKTSLAAIQATQFPVVKCCGIKYSGGLNRVVLYFLSVPSPNVNICSLWRAQVIPESDISGFHLDGSCVAQVGPCNAIRVSCFPSFPSTYSSSPRSLFFSLFYFLQPLYLCIVFSCSMR